MKLLNDVEQIDPSNPELISLLKQAKAGQEQEQRRRVVEQLQNEISLATTHEQLTTVAARVNMALERMPTEPSLLKFRGLLSRRIAESEARREVDETVRRCRALLDTAPQEALELVRKKLREFPGNERLLILQTSVEEEVENSKLQESRAHFLALAHEAISQGQYRQAVRLLETCQADGIVSAEISELLEFARHEAEQQQRESLVETTFAEAQGLLAKGSYEAAIRLLEPAVQQASLTAENRGGAERRATIGQRRAVRRSSNLPRVTARRSPRGSDGAGRDPEAARSVGERGRGFAAGGDCVRRAG